jgi:hypothetical protein
MKGRASKCAAWLLAGCALSAQGSSLRFTNLTDRATTLAIYGNVFVSTVDFDADGRNDLLIGSDNPHSLDRTPLVLLINDGGGAFHDGTAQFIDGQPLLASPIPVTADFNRDGRPDIAIFDAGNLERGQDPSGGFYGEEPVLLLSGPSGKWTVSTALADAARFENQRRFGSAAPGNLHAKSASAADIDRDGDVDIWVESSGGYRNVGNHFMINNGNGTFTSDVSDERLYPTARGVPSNQWRYRSNQLVDMNGDGFPDLVLGQQRRPRNLQDGLASKVVYNDGTGRFRQDRSVDLPYPPFFDGWTTVTSVAVADINADSRPDLILNHTRSQDDTKPDEPQGTGRFVQILVAEGTGRFLDQSETRMGDQSATTVANVADYGRALGTVLKLTWMDADGDGQADIFAAQSNMPLGRNAPLLYMNDGGVFRALDPSLITNNSLWFGENAVAISLNDDGLVDFVHSDLLPGADGVYGTGDERSRIIATLGRR